MNKSQRKLRILLWGCACGGVVGLLADPAAFAQVSADRTLPQNSIVETNGNTFNITGGSLSGTNLFHSFSEFSLNSAQTAHFQNDAAIANILSRVTGNNVSNIDGLIRTNGSANLFLVNPNGIVFGENARLDVGGSFVASTADAIEFAGGELFPAQDNGTTPLLTMTVPVGLQFNSNSANGAIAVNGAGHSFTREDPIFAPTEGLGQLENGLQVLPGNNLALIGNRIDLNGGLLSVAGGNIELASLSTGKVRFTPTEQGWQFSYAPIAGELSFSDVNLRDRAAVDGSGIFTSSINLNTHNLNIEAGSLIAVQNQGSNPGSNIQVNASGDLLLSGTTADATVQSAITNTTLAPGKAGAIAVTARNLSLFNGGRIVSRTFSNADGGDVEVNVEQDLSLIGFSPINPRAFSTIAATTQSSGHSGDVRVNTHNLIARDAGVLSSSTFSSGSGGNVFVRAAESILLAGAEPLTTTPSAITATTLNEGQAGNVTIDTKNLIVEQGGRVDSSTLAFGDAGSMVINASESVILSGDRSQPGEPGLIASASAIVSEGLQLAFNLPPVPTGNSGNVTINTPLLQATNEGLISVISEGSGNPGTVTINSDHIVLTNRGGIFALTDSGSGGNIKIDTGDLDVFAAFINASSIGTGDAGDIDINATGNITVSDVGFLPFLLSTALPLLSGLPGGIDPQRINGVTAITSGSGESGNIIIQADQLTLRDGGFIVSGTVGAGDAGDLIIRVNQLLEIDGGLLAAPTALSTGNGGNLEIESSKIMLRNGGSINATTTGAGDAGNLIIRASEAIDIADFIVTGANIPRFETVVSTIGSNTTPLSTGNGGDLIIITPRLSISNRAFVPVSSEGTGNAGNLIIQAGTITQNDAAKILANSVSGSGGNIDMQIADSLVLRNQSSISTTAGIDQNSSGDGGNINISVPVLVLLEQSTIDANAFLGNGGNIDIVTSGLFNSANSAITASSQLGVDGLVEVNSPDIDPSSGLTELETEVTDFSTLIAVGCDADRGNTFIATGRSGLPASPREIVRAEPSVIDWRSPFSEPPTPDTATNPDNQEQSAIALNSANPDAKVEPIENPDRQESPKLKKIDEVRGWHVDQNGKIVLVVNEPNPSLPLDLSIKPAFSCETITDSH
jgi:filamentous hemagglutinin family protein